MTIWGGVKSSFLQIQGRKKVGVRGKARNDRG